MKKVLIIYRFLPHYRVDFYNGLKKSLEEHNIELQLIYGKTNKVDALKNDEVDIEWATYIPNVYIRIGRMELIWQPCLRHFKGKDLIIVEGANKLIINYILMIARHFSRFKLGVWGHGRNFQQEINSKENRFKTLFLRKCDCYFAYTEGVKKYLTNNRFDPEKIVVVQNAIQTSNLKDQYREIQASEVEKINEELGTDSEKIGIYCGGMYPQKRIDFIIEACQKIRNEIPDFHMVFVGSGIDSDKAKAASEKFDWIHYVGPKFGKEKVKYFKVSSVQLMPGLVGLAVIDSFALETPLITTDYPYHSPEIEYLENGVNGIITKDDIDEYARAVIDVLRLKDYETLIAGCRKSAEVYTIDKMVSNYKEGILNHI